MLILLFACQDDGSKITENTPPQISVISQQDGDVVPSGELLQLQAQASDGEDEPEELVIWWTQEGQQICPPLQWSFGLSSCSVTLEEGAHNIAAYVTDSAGVESSSSLVLNAEVQNNLTLEILSPLDGSSWYADQIVPFQGRATGESLEDITFEWSSSRDGVIAGGDALDVNNESITETLLSSGDHQIIWSAIQNEAVIADAAVTVSVDAPNTAPLCEILSPAPPEGEDDYVVWSVDSEHLLQGQASDNEVVASELTYTWTSDLDGTLFTDSVTNDGQIESSVDLSAGLHQLTLLVQDEVGAPCEAISSVYINTPPTIQILSPAPEQLFQSGEIVSLLVSGDDAEDGAAGLAVSINSDISGFLGTANLDGAGNGYADLILDTGIHTLEVTATDSGGFSTTASIEITVNTPPTAPDLILEPDPAYTSDELVATASGSFDLEGEVLVYSYSWYRDGVLQPSQTGSTVSSSDTLKGEEWQVEVYASDSFIAGPSTSASVTIQNTPPLVDSVTLSPTLQPNSQDSLSCSANVSDPDDTPTVVITWLDDGVPLTTGDTVDLSQFTVLPNSVITCEVAATDIDGVTTVESATAVVQNSTPVIDSISVSPDPIYADSGLICSASVSDIDQNSITIDTEWLQNGVQIGQGVTIDLDPSVILVGDVISCQITAEDSYGGTVTDAQEMIVQNTNPVISEVNITPPSAYADSIVTCQLTAADLNGTAITESYSWEVQSTGQVLGNQADLALTPSLVSPDDIVVCTAVATDANGGTDESTSFISILNTEPVITNGPTISPSSGIQVGTPLLCSATVEDLDDGVLTWTNIWYSDGVEVSTSSTFTPSESNSNVDSTLSCLITAVDSDGGTVSASTSVVIGNTAPVMDSVVISPNSDVTTDAQLQCVGSGTDADLDALTYSYTWFNNTTGQQIGASDNLQLTPTLVAPEDEVSCSVTVEDENGSTDTLSEVITIVNTEPVLTSVEVVPSQGAVTNTLLSCEASAEDLDNDTLTYSYLWAKGNILLGASSTLQLAPTVVQPLDTITCTVTVTDTYSGSDTDVATVAIENTNPVISSVDINPSTFFNDQSLSCSVTATDSDNQALVESFQWQNTTTGQVLGSSANLVLTSTAASVGDSIECTATVTDPNSGSAVESSSSTVVNRAPNLSTVTITPNTDVTTSESLSCSSAASDPDNEALTTTYQWLSGGSLLGTGPSFALTPSMVQPGDTVQCRATVTDPSGAEDSNQASVDIINIVPVATDISISPSVIYNDSTVTCTINGTDGDGQSLTESYQWRIGGVLIGNTQTISLSSLTASVGDELECTGTLTDVSGGADSLVQTVTIENRVPTVTGVTILPSSPTTSSTLSCSVTGEDADDESLTDTYSWLNVSTGQTLGTGSTLVLDPSIVQPDEVIQCAAQLTDPNSASANDSQTVIAINTAPVISSVSISPSTAYNDTALSCSVSGSDADDQSIVASYQWFNDTVEIGTGQTLALTSSLAQVGDSISCEATLTDTSGDSVSETVDITLSNRGPIATSAVISPASNVVIGTTLTCAGVASDPDDDSLSISYTWVKGISVLSSTDTLTLQASQVQPGDTVSCIMTVSDPSGITDTTSDSIIVNNTPPEIDSLSISPGTFNNDDTLSCDISASDLDEQSLSIDIQWSNSGNTLGTNEELTLFPSVAMPGDVIRCTVVVTDTSGASVSSFTEGTVLNRNPSVTSPTLSSNSPTLGSTLTCSASGTDVDNDSVVVDYQWYINSTSSSVVHTGASLEILASGTPTSGQVVALVDDEVFCVATATDANGASDTKQVSASIINTDPTIASVSIAPTTAYNDSTLSCAVVASDSDAQTLSTSYTWTNGSSTLGTSSSLTLSSSTAVPGDTIRCTAVVTDSSGGSATGFAQRTMTNRDPVISTPSLSSSSPTLGSTLTCSASGSDVDNDTVAVSYAWYINSVSSSVVHTGASLELLAGGTPSSGQVVANIGDNVFCRATATDVNGASDTKQVDAQIVNTNPIISSVTIAPSTAYNDSTLTCTVVASDSDAQSLNVVYSWSNGSSTLGTSQSLSLSSATAVPGDTIRCTATVTDSSGGSDTLFEERTMTNRDPSVTPPSLSSSSPTLGSTLTCSSTGSDADNDSVTVSYAWFINNVSGSAVHSGASLELLASGTPSSGQVVAEVGDDVFCVATATDANGGTDTKQIDVNIANTNPNISSVTVTPSTAYNNSTLACTVVASDSDAQSLTTSYAWTNGSSTLGTNQTLTLSSASAVPGDVIRCTAVVTDPSGGSDSLFTNRTLTNRAPVVTTPSLSSSNPTLGSTLTCSASAFDNDNDSLSISYAWHINSVSGSGVHTGASLELIASGTPGAGQVVAAVGDDVFCVATATDVNGATDTKQVDAKIINTDPVISSVTIGPSTAYNDSTLTCTVVASDSDAQTTTTTYAWTNGSTTLGTNQTLSLSSAAAVPGDTIRCTAVVTDSSGGSDSLFATRTLTNRAPVVTTPAFSSSSPTLGSTLTCSASGSDVDNDTVTVSYAWYLNSVGGTPLYTNQTLTLIASGTPVLGQVLAEVGDDVFCVVTATDTSGATDTKQADVNIVNTNPNISSVSISPSTAYNDSTLTCTVVASDSDAQSLSTSYTWTNGSTTLGTSQSLVLTSAGASPGDAIRCTAVVTDPSGGSDSLFAERTLTNRAPAVTTPSLTSITPALGDTLTCSASGSDADNDSVTVSYAWYLNSTSSSVVHTGASLELLASGSAGTGQVVASIGDSLICVVTAMDPSGLTDTDQANATVVNTPPVISSISITPSSGVYNDSALTCGVSASDTDAHTLTTSYTWTNQTQGTTLGTSASLTLSSATASRNEVIRCAVTVSDGFGGSDSLFTSVTTENRRPVISSVAIDNTSPSFGDTVNCSAVVTDADNDSINVSSVWVRGGSNVGSGQSYTISYSDLGQTLICRVTANDGLLSQTRDSSIDNSSILIDDLVVSGTSLTLPEGTYDFGTLSVINGGTLNVIGTTSLTLEDITVDAGASINGDGRAGNAGPMASDATGNGASLHASNNASGGGGYGGEGGNGGGSGSISVGGSSFGTVSGTDISVGGGSAGVSCQDGSSGGAALSIFISGVGIIAGDITVNGADGQNCGDPRTTGGGAGGGLLVGRLGAGSLDFTGFMSAFGGNGGLCLASNCDGGGGGGGGRVKILDFPSFVNMTGTFNVDGGLGDTAGNKPGDDGETGTIYIENFHNGEVQHVNGMWLDVSYESCGVSCDATTAQAVCSALGKKLVSHASDGSTSIQSLGAADSCLFSTSYFTVDTNMPDSACIVGVSSLEWSSSNSCCNSGEWHGYSIPFGTPADIFGRVVNGDSGYVPSYPNLANGTDWGCYNTGISASVAPSCTEVYVACAN